MAMEALEVMEEAMEAMEALEAMVEDIGVRRDNLNNLILKKRVYFNFYLRCDYKCENTIFYFFYRILNRLIFNHFLKLCLLIGFDALINS